MVLDNDFLYCNGNISLQFQRKAHYFSCYISNKCNSKKISQLPYKVSFTVTPDVINVDSDTDFVISFVSTDSYFPFFVVLM